MSRFALCFAFVLMGCVPTAGTGENGLQGEVGATGPQGQPGLAGMAGSTGPTGAPGQPGLVGPTGADGTPGSTGPRGVSGDQGVPGPTGPATAVFEMRYRGFWQDSTGLATMGGGSQQSFPFISAGQPYTIHYVAQLVDGTGSGAPMAPSDNGTLTVKLTWSFFDTVKSSFTDVATNDSFIITVNDGTLQSGTLQGTLPSPATLSPSGNSLIQNIALNLVASAIGDNLTLGAGNMLFVLVHATSP